MIPLHKLEKLPRSQRLRKAAKIVGEAEHRLAALGKFPPQETEYLADLARLLAADKDFPQAAVDALVAVQFADSGSLRRSLNTVYHLLMAETGRYPADWDFIESSGALDTSKRRTFAGMQVYLEDIRSPFNVGAIFRAAESFGAEKMWLSPLCADPRHKRAERTAMGCVDIVPWERLSHDPFAGPGPFFALETGGVPISDFRFPQNGLLIVGSEELGASPAALAAADSSLGRVSIPTYGGKWSLNVAVDFGIVMKAWAGALNS
jgi:TrmH family RNA methyltransferase